MRHQVAAGGAKPTVSVRITAAQRAPPGARWDPGQTIGRPPIRLRLSGLNRVDLPTLVYPTMDTVGSSAFGTSCPVALALHPAGFSVNLLNAQWPAVGLEVSRGPKPDAAALPLKWVQPRTAVWRC
jgi:hypothetical protein